MNRINVFAFAFSLMMVPALRADDSLISVTDWDTRTVTLTNGQSITSSSSPSRTLPAQAGTPLFHIDASDMTGWEFVESDGKKYVSKLPSATGDGRYLYLKSWDGRCLNGPFIRENDPELQGGRTLDFGKQGSRLGLTFDGGKLQGIGTIIAVWGSQNGGGWVLGGGAWTAGDNYRHEGYAFHRGGNAIDNSDNVILPNSHIFKSPAYPALVDCACWLDGNRIDPLRMGFSGNYQILSIVAADTTPWAEGLGINDTRIWSRSGGQRVAEMIIYPTRLGDADRRAVEAYLAEKWFGRKVAGYNGYSGISVLKVTQTQQIDLPEGETLAVSRLTDVRHPNRIPPKGRSTVKRGKGTLELGESSGLADVLKLEEGGLSFDARQIPAALPPDPVFHIDASAADSLTLETAETGETRVCEWRDADGRSIHAYAVEPGNRPTLLPHSLNGKPVVDFGLYGSGEYLQWSTNMAYIGSVVWVLGAQNGGGQLLGYSSGENCQFERGGGGASIYTPLWRGSLTFPLRQCKTYINGIPVNPTNASLSATYQVVGVHAMGAIANQFAAHYTRGGSELTGGQRLAEVVVYNRILTDRELEDAQAYLMKKWLNTSAPGYDRLDDGRPDLQGVHISTEGIIHVDGGTVRVRNLKGNGRLVKTGPGTLAIEGEGAFYGNVDLREGAVKTLPLTLQADQPAKGAAFHLDASRPETFETISRNGTNFVSRWYDVSGWKNAAVRYDRRDDRPLPWIRTDDPANGNPVVDFGVRGSCRMLAFLKPVDQIRAVYVVIGTQDGCGNFLLGTAREFQICDFHRGGDDTLDDYRRPLFQNFDFEWPTYAAPIYVDGVKKDGNVGLSGGYQLVEVYPMAGLRASALAADRYDGTINFEHPEYEIVRRTGGQRIGEVILYDRVLTEREQIATRNYLMKKWFGRDPLPLPEEKEFEIGALRLGQGNEEKNIRLEHPLSLTDLSGSGSLTKEGSEVLSIGSTSDYTGTVRVAEGTVALRAVQIDQQPSLVQEGLLFHVDAAENVEWKLVDGVRRVTRWGSMLKDGWYAYPPKKLPTYLEADLFGLPVVDLGKMGSLQHMLFKKEGSESPKVDPIKNIRSVFWVFGSQNGGGYLLGGGKNAFNPNAHYNFHRGNLPGKQDVEDPMVPGQAIWSQWNTDKPIGQGLNRTYLNGKQVDGTKTGLSGNYDLVELLITNGCTEAEGFAFDGRYIDDGSSYSSRTGGQRLAEVLMYDRVLTEEERLNVEYYLQMKWGLKKIQIGNASHMTLSLTPNGTVDLSGKRHSISNLEGIGSIENGELQVLDELSTRQAGEQGSLQVNADLELCDDSVLSVDLLPSEEDLIAVTGACRLGRNVRVHIRPRGDAASLSDYQIPLMRAGEWQDEANLSSWTVGGDIPPGFVGSVSRQGDLLLLHVSRGGTILLLR